MGTLALDQQPGPLRTPRWRTHAVCATEAASTALFFSEDLGDIATAKRMCARCPVMAECLEEAIVNQEPWGVWGGQLFLNGRMLTVKRGRGRPPRIPRPEDQLLQIPVPEHLQARIRTA
jgi:WhiB family transcriptional regulator, redox-sensing transcriptional regulator